VPYAGPALARPKAESTWAAEVAGLAPGDRPYFILHPSGLIVRIRDDHQANVDRFVGVLDRGEVDDVFFYNGTLTPWALDANTVGGPGGPTAAEVAKAVLDGMGQRMDS
jgi:hypothetical protein